MRPIIALDFATAAKTVDFLNQFPDTPLSVKVGMELFYGEGPQVIAAIQKRPQTEIFLDLKLHDIPHTVEQAARQIGRLGVQLTTVHALGGPEMMAAAKRGLLAGAKSAGVLAPKLLAITQLTSTSQAMLNQDIRIPGTVLASVRQLAQLAHQAGADGVVASAQEVQAIREVTPVDFLVVTPGIRPANAASDDQHRVVTPQQAKALGSSSIVVGRPITQSPDAVSAYQSIKAAWED
ncbi:orotidine-5'-phosphate decarboxylase [Lacticaseibacillus brantae]|uniref:Orotidine 5'-phosphate decarboxylase n=1 Tax=Lacticaseibacillus brantae DSM 23927 TaxID=1423727 RepID=A0A0R2BAL6_9LACO|nr:orotidine-5'-phosphate decarboxylase [Lacticaseibacillus brantae]KRM72643.1 orotidine-5-phosphate decarboxylase [Lacticaseibacillus brantae DSM 23927]